MTKEEVSAIKRIVSSMMGYEAKEAYNPSDLSEMDLLKRKAYYAICCALDSLQPTDTYCSHDARAIDEYGFFRIPNDDCEHRRWKKVFSTRADQSDYMHYTDTWWYIITERKYKAHPTAYKAYFTTAYADDKVYEGPSLQEAIKASARHWIDFVIKYPHILEKEKEE